MKYGFIGLGQMGAPMAENLANEFDVVVFDRNEKVSSAFLDKKVTVAKRLEDFSNVDVLFLSLPSSDIVSAVLFDEQDGAARYLKPGAVVVDTSTIEYAQTLNIESKLTSCDVKFIDAPVSGMQARAEDGSLTIMCGGDLQLVENILPCLRTMAAKIFHMGPVGSGQLAKLINQLLFDINAAALAEILPLATKLGLDPEKTGEIVNSGTGRSFASEFFIPNILNGDFSNGYPMQAAYKDLISGAEISANYQIPTPLLAAATATYQQALCEGHGAKDKGGMILVFEKLLGTSFRKASNKGAEND